MPSQSGNYGPRWLGPLPEGGIEFGREICSLEALGMEVGGSHAFLESHHPNKAGARVVGGVSDSLCSAVITGPRL